MRLGQLLHDPAKGALAVGAAHGPKARMQARMKVLEVTVVRKDPVTTPQFTHKRMAIFKRHRALCSLADVRNDVLTFDGIAPNQFCHRRTAGLLVIDKVAHANAFTAIATGDIPALRTGAAAAIASIRRYTGRA